MIKHFFIIIVIALIFFLPGVRAASADSRETKRVLVLYSLEKGNVGQDMVDAKLHEIFSRNKTFNIQLYNDLDLIRFPALENNSALNIFDRYKQYIVAGVLFLIVQTVLIVVLIDMNRKKKKTSIQLREFVDRYHELLRVDRSSRLGELTASLAHELNQPIAAILSNAQAALRFLASGRNDPELSREILQNIVQDDKRAADIIRSLRSMVKRGETAKETININEALREVIDIARGALISHDILVKPFLDETLPLVIANKTQTQQVALNLIMNAMDAVSQSAPDKKKIVLKTDLLEGFVRVSVHDYGPGIPAEQVDKVFEPFYTTKINGLGMGLAVCKSIIADHGGRIWSENNPEGGSTFFFVLRVADHV